VLVRKGLKIGVIYGLFLEIARLSWSNNLEKKVFSNSTLATLPLPPSLQTFFTTSTTLWTHLLQ